MCIWRMAFFIQYLLNLCSGDSAMNYVRGTKMGREELQTWGVGCPVTTVWIQSDFTEACGVIESRIQSL